MTVAVEHAPPGVAERVSQRRTRVPHGALLIVVIFALFAVLAIRWYRGGTFLHSAGGGWGGVVATNEPFSFGIDLTTTGSSVILDHASATYPEGLRASWSVYRNRPGDLALGAWNGPLAPRWSTVPVHGYRVAQPSGRPERGAVLLVTSVTASTPGVYRIADIEIHYRSGARHRTVGGDAEACILVAAPADVRRLAREIDAFRPHVTDLGSVSRLVAEYETCSDATLGN